MNLEEIKAAIAADPALKSGLYAAVQPEVLAAAKASGMIIRTKEEDTQFMTNYDSSVIPGKVDAAVSEKIGEKMKTTLDALDAKILSVSGIAKNPNEKSTDYAERALKEAKSSGGKNDSELAKLLQQAQQALEEKKDFVDPKEVQSLKQKYFEEKVSLHIAAAQEGQTFVVPAHITDDKEKQAYIDNQKRLIALDLRNRYKPKEDKDGNIIFHDGDNPIIDNSTGKPKAVASIILETYKGYFAPAKPPGGGGSGPSGGGGGSDPDEGQLKTKKQVNEHLSKKYPNAGIGDPERTKEYKRIIQEQGITDDGE